MSPEAQLTPDQAAFIEAQPRGATYSQLVVLLRQRFGEAEAFDRESLYRWWIASHRAHERRVVHRDPEVREAILDLAGRLNGREIMDVLAARFAPSRLPSRSALYRCLAELKARA